MGIWPVKTILVLYIALASFMPNQPATTAHLLTYPGVTQAQCDAAIAKYRFAADIMQGWPEEGRGYWSVRYAWCEEKQVPGR